MDRAGGERLRAIALLALLAGVGGASERMSVEIESDATQTAEMAAKEAEATAGMDQGLRDTLTDIMAVLQHGSDASKDQSISHLINIAVQSAGAGKEQARMFRSAVVAGGALPSLVSALESKLPQRRFLGARALHALALDDPTTDLDNFHAEEICQHGAIPLLVKALHDEEENVQASATATLSQLAENPTCQQMIVAEGAIEPLVGMASYADDLHKLNAMNALDVLALNNPQ
ncbi:MAG: hypothetical protein SGPRY_005116, partial [Prymnesium sp.]